MYSDERPLTPLERLHRLTAILEAAVAHVEADPVPERRADRQAAALQTARLLAAAELEVDSLLATAVVEAANNGATWTQVGEAVGYTLRGTRIRWMTVDRDFPQGTRRRVGGNPGVVPAVLHELGLDGQDHYDNSTVLAPPQAGPDL
jgi:hypothetical protein